MDQNQEQTNALFLQLLADLVSRVSAMEKVMIDKNIVTEKELADAIVDSMGKIKDVLDQLNS